MPEGKKSKAPIEDPVLAKLVKQSECTADGNKTKMLMYNKAEYVRAKFDLRPDCTIKTDKCDNNLNKGDKPTIYPESSGARIMKLKPTQPPCPKPNTRPNHAPIFEMGHRIRMCTVEEMHQMCPEPCFKPSPPPKPRLLLRIGSLAIKMAIAGSLVWWTYDIGLWGDGYQSERLWQGTVNAIFGPEKKKERDSKCPTGIEKGMYEFRDAYNRTAIAITAAIANLPYSVLPESMTKSKNCKENMTQQTSGRVPSRHDLC